MARDFDRLFPRVWEDTQPQQTNVLAFPSTSETRVHRDVALERKAARLQADGERTVHLVAAARLEERQRVQPLFWWAGCRFGFVLGWIVGVVLVAGALWAGRRMPLRELAASLLS